MNTTLTIPNRRVLIVDDNTTIHGDFRKILAALDSTESALDAAEASVFGAPSRVTFELDSAFQGEDALQMVERAEAEGRPYAMAFVDYRMPPGWDGAETTKRLWQASPLLQIVICTAFADCSWDEVLKSLDPQDRLLILKKPFDSIEALQLTNALTAKWNLHRESKTQMGTLAAAVEERTRELKASEKSALHLLNTALLNRDKAETALEELGREIGERERAETELCNTRLLVDGINNAIPVSLFWKDKNLVFLGCNAAFAHDAGFANAKDIIGKDDHQMVWRDQAESYRADDRQVIESGLPRLLIEESQTTPQGDTITLLTNKIPLRSANGEIIGVLGTCIDITARKRLEESHTRLAMVVEQSAEIIVITDPSGAITYVNPAFEKTTGYTRAEAIGQNPRLIKSGKHDADFYRQMWDVLGRGEVWHGHMINRRKDGKLFEEEATLSPIRDATGKVINYVAVKRDVTREVQLEAQFRQSQKMEGIGQLAGGIAHDFNNILAVIMMQADLACLAESMPEKVREGLEGIQAAAKRAANLTRQLLLFSRKQVMQPRQLDVNEVVTSLAKMLQRIIREDVLLELQLHSTPMMTFADAGMLDQVLMNLAVNARDAMPKGGILIIETAEKVIDAEYAAHNPEASPGRFVWLSVSDTGCGMTPEIQARIFEPFFTTKEVGQGTGLGLATVFGIVKQHHGWVKVHSEVGKGTNFQVFLPMCDVPHEVLTKEASKPKARGGTETILMAEDEPDVRMLTRMILERNGYHVLEAADGVEAQRVWAEYQGGIALLLTDLVMPGGVGGNELAALLQAQKPELKVVFTSGYSADNAGRAMKLQAGQSFVPKPSPPDRLLEAIRNGLDY